MMSPAEFDAFNAEQRNHYTDRPVLSDDDKRLLSALDYFAERPHALKAGPPTRRNVR